MTKHGRRPITLTISLFMSIFIYVFVLKMETGSKVIICVFFIVICFTLYDLIPSKYTKLEDSFVGFMKRSQVRFDYEKSPLHTIVYGGTGTG